MTGFRLFSVFISSLLLLSCQSEQSNTLTIATAANMQFAMKEIVEAFEQETNIKCQVILGSSGKLTAQISAGAPYDLLVSADTTYPMQLYRDGLTLNSPGIYGFGKLVIWTMESSLDLNKPITFLNQAAETTQHLALANPRTAPYGQAAEEVLNNLGNLEKWQSRLVYGESIGQVNQFVSTGAADVGITAKSVVLATGEGYWVDIPDSLYLPIAQGAVLLKSGTTQAENARQFYLFLFTDTVKEILDKFGYATSRE